MTTANAAPVRALDRGAAGSSLRRPAFAGVGAAIAVGLLFVLNVGLGSVTISPSRTVAALTGQGDPVAGLIIVQLRLPGALIALVAGAMLGLAGALLQSVLRNPLVEPTLIGIGPGGVLFVVLWNVYGPGGANGAALPLLAAVGGLLAGATVYLLSRAGGGNPLRVTLTGVLVGAMLTSASSLLLLLHPTQIGAVLLFTIGSLDGLTWLHWGTIWPWALVALPLGLASAGFANALQLGDEISAGLGLGVRRARVGLLAVAVALTAGAVSVVGAIGFLGLVAPHMARPFAGADCRRLFALSALFGMLLLLAANLPSRLITSPTLPVGVTVAIVGAPVFTVLLLRSQARMGR